MKVASAVSVACLIGLVSSEQCTSSANVATECSHMACVGGWHLTCFNRVCTCVQDSPDRTPCSTKADCDALTTWQCAADRRHCVDGQCRCFRG